MSRRKANKTMTEIDSIPDGGNGLIYAGFPRERFLIPEFVDCRDSILAHMTEMGVACGYFNANGHRVDKNRDSIVKTFLEHEMKPEWLLMLDTDMEHPREIAEVLSKHRKPIVGGLYFHRGLPHDPFVFTYIGELKDGLGRTAPHWAPKRSLVYRFIMESGLPLADGSFHVKNPPFDPLVECDAVATGALLIHRSVLENIPQPHFEYRELAISEDLMFCKLARDNGYKVYCDLSCISGHYKSIPIGQAQFRAMYEAMPINATKFTKDRAYEDLAVHLGISLDKAKLLIDNGDATATKAVWDKELPQTDQEIADFYRDDKTGKAYLVELMYWNNSDVFTRLRSSLHMRNADILEIGAGIGTITCQLAIQMNQVTAVEVNSVLREFMKLRIAQMLMTPGLECVPPTVIDKEDWWNEVPDSSQDYVMAFDVFEHIPEPELRQIVKHAAEKMRPGGRMIFHNNFGQQDLYPMHLDHSAVWSNILEEAGLFEVSPLEAVKRK